MVAKPVSGGSAPRAENETPILQPRPNPFRVTMGGAEKGVE
jgi:hypothetical protein